MPRMLFTPGTRFVLDGELCTVLEIHPENRFTVENATRKGRNILSLDELTDAFFSGKLAFEVLGLNAKKLKNMPVATELVLTDFDSVPEKYRQEAWRRYEIIKPLLRVPPRLRTRAYIEEYVRNLAAKKLENPPKQPAHRRRGRRIGSALSHTSVETWLDRFVGSGYDPRVLVPYLRGSKNKGRRRLKSGVEDCITESLNYCDTHPAKRSLEDVYLMVVNKVNQENEVRAKKNDPEFPPLQRPGERTVYRRIVAFGGDRVLKRRKGRLAKHKEEPVQAGVHPTRILENVEFDTTRIPLVVVDEEDRMPVGFVTFGVGIDGHSQMPTGLDLSFEPAGYNTIMRVMLNSIKKKPDVQKLYGTIHPWHVCGLMEMATVDNGPEFLNDSLVEACVNSGIILNQCPVRMPWLKPRVERFFKTHDDGLVHLLPGSNFYEILEKGDYDPDKTACISLTRLRELIHIFILDNFAAKFHESKVSGFAGIPMKVWEQNLQAGFLPALPANLKELEITFFRTEYRTLQPSGIDYEVLRFQGNDLSRLRSLLKTKREGMKVKIKVNPEDLGYIYVHDPYEDEYLRFDALRQDYATGLSLWKHGILRKNVLKLKHEVDVNDLIRMKLRIQEIVDQEYSSTRNRRRSKAKRFKDEEPSGLISTATPDRVPLSDHTLIQSQADALPAGDLAPRLNPPEPGQISTQDTQGPTTTDKTGPDQPPAPTEASKKPKVDDFDFDQPGWGGDLNLPKSQ